MKRIIKILTQIMESTTPSNLEIVLESYEESSHNLENKTYRDKKINVSEGEWHPSADEDVEINSWDIWIEGMGDVYLNLLVMSGGYLLPNRVVVDENHRRQGYATAMYVQAEYDLGMKIKRHTEQSRDGIGLWNQPNRPFG